MAEGQGTSMFQADQDKEQVPINEEEITEEKKSPLCEICVKKGPPVREDLSGLAHQVVEKRWLENCVAVLLCYECEMYLCVNCLLGHKSHEGMRGGRKENEREGEKEASESNGMEEQTSSERMKNKGKGLGKKSKRMCLEHERDEKGEKRESDRMEEEKEREKTKSKRMEGENERKLRLLLDNLMKESETERIEKFDKRHVSIYDRVYVKHKLDRWNCRISGLCVLENQRWVACDCRNHCIKIFTLGSNVLQRYIRFVCEPYDVTEIFVNQNSTEPNLASGSSSGVSVTDRAEQDKKCLTAVTVPLELQIMFIDLSKKPAFIHKIIRTEGRCYSIQFYDDNIFTVCKEDRPDSPRSVYLYSTDGDTLNKFDIGSYGNFIYGPHLAVVSGRVYLIDTDNNKVQCRNFKGHILSELTIEESGLEGTSVDPDNVYVCARNHGKVYKLDADLTRYESVLDQTAGYIERPEALCYYRDKLFISHNGSPSLRNFVTVVRLL